MGPIAVDLALLRDVLLPGLTLTPGRTVAARVVDAQDGRGSLSIAGYLIEAELPRGVRAGDTLRLVVRDVDARRVLLAITAENPEPPPAVGAETVALPGGGRLSVIDDESSSGGGAGQGETHRLALRLALGALGTVELRFAMDPATLALDVALAPGDPLSRARETSAALGEALAEAAQRPARVTVSPRREPLDVYA